MAHIPEHLLKNATKLEGSDIKAFWNPELGGYVHCIIRKLGSRRGDDRKYLICQLLSDCKCQDGDKNPVDAKPGDHIMMDYKAGLENKLDTIVGTQPTVVIKPLDKVQISGGREMWTFEVHKLPDANPAQDNIPF